MNDLFSKIAHWTSQHAGRASTFVLAALVVLAWAVTGPMFGFSDTWQLIVNTGTTIVTFLMVFLIQNTQNRDTQAIQLKLDEVIGVTREARNSLIDLEDASEEKLQEAKEEFLRLKERPLETSARKIEEVEEDLEESQESLSEIRQDLSRRGGDR